MDVRALSVKNPHADLIFWQEKTIEVRTWQTDYRGDLLICSSANPKIEGMISGYALVKCTLKDVTPLKKGHLEAACLDELPKGEYFAWHLDEFELIKPFKVRGRLNLYEVDDSSIETIFLEEETEECANAIYSKYFEPLEYKKRKN